jgi:hypothetical protein
MINNDATEPLDSPGLLLLSEAEVKQGAWSRRGFPSRHPNSLLTPGESLTAGASAGPASGVLG